MSLNHKYSFDLAAPAQLSRAVL